MAPTRYESDYHQWSVEQAGYLRRHEFDKLDLPHLADEIEDLAVHEEHDIEDRLELLLIHLLRWQNDPGNRSKTWALNILVERRDLESVLADNPSLLDLPVSRLAAIYGRASVVLHAESIPDLDALPATCPFTIDQIRDEAFLPE